MTIKILLLTIIVTIGLFSCDPCKNLDCASSNYSGQFRIISKTDSSDLVFGSKKIYDKNEIKFYSINNNDTTYFEYKAIKFGGDKYDSILYVYFYPQTFTNVYMRLSSTDTDTLTMTFKTFDTKCCGRITEIDKFLYNNLTQISGNVGTQVILK